MHPYYLELGKRVRALRQAKGWTQQDLAERCGLTAAFLSYLESGSRKGSLDSYLKLSEVLGVGPAQLLGQGGGGKDSYPSLSLEGLSFGDSKALKQMARTLRRKR